MPGELQALGHRLQALAITGPEQAAQVERRPVPRRLATHRGEVRRQPHVQIHRVDTILAHGCLLLLQPARQRTKQPQSAQVVLAPSALRICLRGRKGAKAVLPCTFST